MAGRPEEKYVASVYIAKCLKAQGVQVAFGVVGIPVTHFAAELQAEGIKFIAMRNEQAASYAASVYGYLTGTLAVCLTVSGPGFVHGLPGLLNATQNCWPMVLISSTAYARQKGKGSFQETDQIEAAKVYAKHCIRISHEDDIAFSIESAWRYAYYGRPGGVYLEIPREIFEGGKVKDYNVPNLIPPRPRSLPESDQLKEAVHLLLGSKKPLLIVGKGAGYCRAEEELIQFVDHFKIPFLPSPMGKGVIPDSHPFCAGPARSTALAEADFIITVGVRMNWMFDFAQKFSPKAKIVQVELAGESFHDTLRADVALQGDAKLVVNELTTLLRTQQDSVTKSQEDWDDWRKILDAKISQNKKVVEPKYSDKSVPMKYHFVLKTIKDFLPENVILVNEGANTMDIGRLVFTHDIPRSRLDAGTLGTMGIGVGYALAAAVAFPERKVVVVQGDSAFGFSGMEVEVACRYNLPITFIVLNNNGIYRGVSELDSTSPLSVPATCLIPNAHYEKIIEAFGGEAFYSDHSDDLPGKVKAAISSKRPSLLNIMIDPNGPIPGIVEPRH